MALLEVADLVVEFRTSAGHLRAVDGISFTVEEGEILAVVGESGSGKSVSMLAVLGLLPTTATVRVSRVTFDGRDLTALSPRQRRRLLGYLQEKEPATLVVSTLLDKRARRDPLSAVYRMVARLSRVWKSLSGIRRAPSIPSRASGPTGGRSAGRRLTRMIL